MYIFYPAHGMTLSRLQCLSGMDNACIDRQYLYRRYGERLIPFYRYGYIDFPKVLILIKSLYYRHYKIMYNGYN